MKNLTPFIITILLLAAGCTSQKKLAYLNNLPEAGGEGFFPMDIPDYKLQFRDILYITAKAMDPEGNIKELLSSTASTSSSQGESGGYLYGYDVNREGNITIPAVGIIRVEGLTLDEAKKTIQVSIDKVFRNSTVECKLQSYKFTVIGEVNAPGTYINYNNYLTVLEAVGRAGGLGDFGSRQKLLVIRPVDKGTKTYRINLQDKNLLTSEAYFLLPNDVVIVQPRGQKIFNLNTPTVSFTLSTIASTISTTLLLIFFFK